MNTKTKHVTDPTMELGERLRNLRKQKGWSLTTAAENAGISRMYLWKLEKETKNKVNPSVRVLRKLCEAYSIGLDQLVSWEPTGDDETKRKFREAQSKLRKKYHFRSISMDTDNIEEMKSFIRLYEQLEAEKA